jgi:hypothetical protein
MVLNLLKMKKIFLLFFLFSLCLVHADAAYREYLSPDKTYIVQVSVRDRDSLLAIKNKKSGKVELSIADLATPILDVQWAPNSQSFIVIQHLAHCSLASLVTKNNSDWKRYDCEPSLKGQYHYSVLDVTFLKDAVQLTYGVSWEQGHRENLIKRVVFTVDHQTCLMSLKKVEPLSLSDFINLRKKEEKNWIST